MGGLKTYGQFCALARALDRLGDRWTLPLVRELLIAPAGYAALARALPGIPTNLLAERLRQLEPDGIVGRIVPPAGARGVRYELTELGRGLEPALLALIRWGPSGWPSGPQRDHFDPELLVASGIVPLREADALQIVGDHALAARLLGDSARPAARRRPSER